MGMLFKGGINRDLCGVDPAVLEAPEISCESQKTHRFFRNSPTTRFHYVHYAGYAWKMI